MLRTTSRASILDCTTPLKLSADTVLAANCRAVSWIAERRSVIVPVIFLRSLPEHLLSICFRMGAEWAASGYLDEIRVDLHLYGRQKLFARGQHIP